MVYRTRTYIAGDWDHDKDAVDQLHKWNDSNYWSLSFTDAHDLTQSNDGSLNCSIKASLKKGWIHLSALYSLLVRRLIQLRLEVVHIVEVIIVGQKHVPKEDL